MAVSTLVSLPTALKCLPLSNTVCVEQLVQYCWDRQPRNSFADLVKCSTKFCAKLDMTVDWLSSCDEIDANIVELSPYDV